MNGGPFYERGDVRGFPSRPEIPYGERADRDDERRDRPGAHPGEGEIIVFQTTTICPGRTEEEKDELKEGAQEKSLLRVEKGVETGQKNVPNARDSQQARDTRCCGCTR